MALIETSQLNLFGLDLTQVAAWLRLGWRQLLCENESPIKHWLLPPVKVMQEEFSGKFTSAVGAEAPDAQFRVVVVENARVLSREVVLPLAAEIFLEDAVSLEAMNNSPFPPEDTVVGWQILHRDKQAIRVEWAVCSRAEVAVALQRAGYVVSEDGSRLPEVWADLGCGSAVLLRGFGETFREAAYLRRVGRLFSRMVIGLVLVLAIAATPALYVSLYADKVDSELISVSALAGVATEAREVLETRRAQLAIAETWASDRIPYRYWLQSLSSLTPDSVYLQRLEFDGAKAVASGLAGNAADYLAVLAESGRFVELEAASAFTRDRTTGLERFTINMVLGELEPEEAPVDE